MQDTHAPVIDGFYDFLDASVAGQQHELPLQTISICSPPPELDDVDEFVERTSEALLKRSNALVDLVSDANAVDCTGDSLAAASSVAATLLCYRHVCTPMDCGILADEICQRVPAHLKELGSSGTVAYDKAFSMVLADIQNSTDEKYVRDLSDCSPEAGFASDDAHEFPKKLHQNLEAHAQVVTEFNDPAVQLVQGAEVHVIPEDLQDDVEAGDPDVLGRANGGIRGTLPGVAADANKLISTLKIALEALEDGTPKIDALQRAIVVCERETAIPGTATIQGLDALIYLYSEVDRVKEQLKKRVTVPSKQ